MRKCERCQSPLPTERLRYANSRFCSEDCRWRSYHQLNRKKLRQYNKDWNRANPESAKATRERTRESRLETLKRWKAANPERVRELRRASAKRRREQAAERHRRWAAQNSESVRQSRQRWLQNNPDKRAADVRSRQLAKVRAEPPWLSKEQKREIARLYREALDLTRATGIPHEVDHIIPIRGKQVCGLHVPWNLQILTQEENQRKGARC